MTDIRNEIELVTPGLNLLEDHGEGAKSVIERTKKILHEAAGRIEELEAALRLIADTDPAGDQHWAGRIARFVLDGGQMTDDLVEGLHPPRRWDLGALVKKKSGAKWHGSIVGFYSTSLTPIGYCVEGAFEENSVRIYPESALEDWHV
jgi:hypothetical protein